MAFMTVAEMVDDILNDMDSDPVTAIDDTEESRQVVQILKTTYFQIIDGRGDNWPHLDKLFRLTETDANSPTHFTIPTNTMMFNWIKYDVLQSGETREKYTTIKRLEPEDFMELVDARNNDDSNVDIISDLGGAGTIKIINDKAPQYYTSFDEEYIVMDSYDSDVETFLKTAKNKCWGKVYPTWTDDDGTFTPDLPVNMFSYFLSEAKSMCFLNIKQAANAKVEQQANSQRRRMSQDAWKDKQSKGIRYPNYGRSPKK
jgi:hypothetical protein